MATRTALPKLGEYDPEHATINADARALAAGAESFAVYAAHKGQGYVLAGFVFVWHGFPVFRGPGARPRDV
jgi:hypothetical protein